MPSPSEEYHMVLSSQLISSDVYLYKKNAECNTDTVAMDLAFSYFSTEKKHQRSSFLCGFLFAADNS
jgi:hypothetical protein